MKGRVLVTEAIDAGGMALLKDCGYEVVMGSGNDEVSVSRDIRGCDAVLTRNAAITERVMCASDRLKVVSMHGVGVDLIDVQAATRLGIQVVNASGSNSLSVAEYTIGLIIALSRNIVLYDRGLRGGNWAVRRALGEDLEGKTLGVVGMGAIGTLVAKKAAAALSMRVLAYRRDLRRAEPIEGVRYTNDFDELLAEADIVSLHLPYTSETRGLIGRGVFQRMKQGAYFINTARGEITDEGALYDALVSGKLAGAAVDVFEGEVPDMDSPLLQLPNVIVTPHTAAFSRQSIARMSYRAALGIHEVLSGKQPSWPVNEVREPARELCV